MGLRIEWIERIEAPRIDGLRIERSLSHGGTGADGRFSWGSPKIFFACGALTTSKYLIVFFGCLFVHMKKWIED